MRLIDPYTTDYQICSSNRAVSDPGQGKEQIGPVLEGCVQSIRVPLPTTWLVIAGVPVRFGTVGTGATGGTRSGKGKDCPCNEAWIS